MKATVATNLAVFHGQASYSADITPGDDLFKNYSLVKERLQVAFRDVDPRNIKQVDDAISAIKECDIPSRLAISMACMRAGARHSGLPLYKFIATVAENVGNMRIPMPSPTVLCRGISFLKEDGETIIPVYQRITMTPTTLTSMDGCMEALAKAAYAVKRKVEELKSVVGFHDGCPVVHYETLGDVLSVIEIAIKEAMVEGNMKFGVDFNMPTMMKMEEIDGISKPTYSLNGANKPALHAPEALEQISSLWRQFELITCEDPFHESDIQSLRQLKNKASNTQSESRKTGSGNMPYTTAGIGGDETCALQMCADTPCFDSEFIRNYDGENVYNTVKIKLNKCGSLFKAIELCKEARRLNWCVIVGTDDDKFPDLCDNFLADFAVGVGASQITAGGMCGAESLSKYHRLLELFEDEESMASTFLGKRFRKP